MTIHYHCTPITPKSQLELLAGSHFCVSFVDKRDIERCHQIGQSVMLDNGAWSTFRDSGKSIDREAYYKWVDEWLDCPTTWAIIPDIINGKEESNDKLVQEWPFGQKGAPVWHLHEPIERLLRLCWQFNRVCFGSSGEYYHVGSNPWSRRIRAAFDALNVFPRLPWIHMLRGMSCAGSKVFPFASMDSSDIARHHNETQNDIYKMARRWDGLQCTIRWEMDRTQLSMFDSGEERIKELELENAKFENRVMYLESAIHLPRPPEPVSTRKT